jgi:hypothetical protein
MPPVACCAFDIFKAQEDASLTCEYHELPVFSRQLLGRCLPAGLRFTHCNLQGDAFVTFQTLEQEAQQAVKPKKPRATPRSKKPSPPHSRRQSQVPPLPPPSPPPTTPPTSSPLWIILNVFYSTEESTSMQLTAHYHPVKLRACLLEQTFGSAVDMYQSLVLIGRPICRLQAGGKSGGKESVILVEAGHYSGQYISFLTLFTYRKHPRKQTSPSRAL